MLINGENSSKHSIRYNLDPPLINFTYHNNWWLDFGANVHVWFDHACFKSYQNSSGASVTLENDYVTHVLGIGQLDLKMTSRKILTLKEVRHVLEVSRNLVSASSLVQQGYKAVLKSNKVVITKNNVFIGKSYVCEGLFKLNVQLLDEINKIPSYVFNFESSNI